MAVDRPPRVRVACTLCSAAKLRCDLNRPCSRCYQRGTGNECHDRPIVKNSNRRRSRSQTCAPCRKAKLSCKSIERPCPRCVRLGFDCLAGNNSDKHNNDIDCCQALRAAPVIPIDDYQTISSSFLTAIFGCISRYSRDQLAQLLFCPEKLDHLSKITCAFVQLDDRLQIREWFYDNFADLKHHKIERFQYLAREQYIEQANRIYRRCYGPILLYNNNVPIIQYLVDYNNPLQAIYTLVLNSLADNLLKHSSSEHHVMRGGVLASSGFTPTASPDFLRQPSMMPDELWRLFPYTSWEDILYWIMDILVLELPSAEFGVEMVTKDGNIIVANSIWRISFHHGTLSLTIIITDVSNTRF